MCSRRRWFCAAAVSTSAATRSEGVRSAFPKSPDSHCATLVSGEFLRKNRRQRQAGQTHAQLHMPMSKTTFICDPHSCQQLPDSHCAEPSQTLSVQHSTQAGLEMVC
jgi:hypothetical protein